MSGNREQMTRHGAPPGASMSSPAPDLRAHPARRRPPLLLVLFAALPALVLVRESRTQ